MGDGFYVGFWLIDRNNWGSLLFVGINVIGYYL